MIKKNFGWDKVLEDIKELNCNTVPEYWKNRQSLFQNRELDLKNISDIDSAGIAFLIHWSKSDPQNKLILKNVPANALKLINTFNLQPIFEIRN